MDFPYSTKIPKVQDLESELERCLNLKKEENIFKLHSLLRVYDVLLGQFLVKSVLKLIVQQLTKVVFKSL